MKIKKILTNILCLSIITSNIIPTMAAYTEQEYSYAENNTKDLKDTQVLYEKAGSYFVTIPKTISLGADKQSDYSVKVEGDISSDRSVYVSPIDGIKDTETFDFYMKDQNAKNAKDNVVATVTQNKFYWNFSEVANGYVETNNKVTAEKLTSGTWQGTFDFEINLRNADGTEIHYHTFVDGVCTGCGEQEHVHDYAESENIIKEATCTEEGEKELTCSCGDTKTEIIPMTEHNYGEDDKCTECGKINNPYETAPETASGNWNYTLDDTNDIITLNYYTGSETDVIVYANYEINGKMYKTQIKSNTDVSALEYYMFNATKHAKCKNIKSIIFSQDIDTSNVTNISMMFYNCSSLTNLDISGFDTSNVTLMDSIFLGCTSLTNLDLSNFDTRKVTSMYSMFSRCSNLKTIYITDGKWSTSQAKTGNMTLGCYASFVNK